MFLLRDRRDRLLHFVNGHQIASSHPAFSELRNYVVEDDQNSEYMKLRT